MKGLKTLPLIGLAILICGLMAGCASHAPQSGPGALNVGQFTLPDGAIGVPYKQVLIASGGQTPYTWTITGGSLPPGLTLQTNGIVSGTPTLTSGTTYPATYNFTAKVTDSQTPTAAFSSLSNSITIQPALTFPAASLNPGVVGSTYTANVTASGGLAPYTYNLVFGALPDGLTLTSSGDNAGQISGVPTAAGTFNFTIQATDTASETATEEFTITVTGRLQGSYTISLNGFFTGTGKPFYLAGSFIADGNGNFTSGVLDQDGPSSVVTNSPFTGTYSLTPGTNLGSMVLVTALGNLAFDIVVSTGNESKIILANAERYGSGSVRRQSSTTLPSTGVTYSFGGFGNDSSGGRYAVAGAFAINTTLGVTGGEEDSNDNGTVASQVSITGGNMGVTPVDGTTGRGTASLTTASGTSNYAYYVISPSELVAVNIDNAGPMALLSFLQQGAAGTTGGGAFTNASLKGQSVLQLNAVNPNGGAPVPDISAGVATFDGAGNISRSTIGDGLPGYFTDENNGGTVTQNLFNGTYSVDAKCGTLNLSCGRVTVTGIGTNQPVWYLSGTNTAFVVGTDPGVTAGTLLPQSGAPFTIGNLLGSYLGGTSNPVLASVTNEVDVVSTPPPGGIFSMTYDSNGPAGPLTSQSFVGPYLFGNIGTQPYGSALGRFVVTTSDPSAPQVYVLYVLGAGASGITGGKTGLVGLSVGTYAGTAEPSPRITSFGH